MRAAGVEPLVDYPGARDRWLCQCTACGELVEPSYDNVRRGQGACRYCVGQGPVTEERAIREMIAVGVESQEPYPGTLLVPWQVACRTCSMVQHQPGCPIRNFLNTTENLQAPPMLWGPKNDGAIGALPSATRSTVEHSFHQGMSASNKSENWDN